MPWNAGKPMTGESLVSVDIRENFALLKTRVLDTGELDYSGLTAAELLTRLGLGKLIFARSTADFIKNANTTLGNVAGLVFAVAANEQWEFIFVLKGITTTAAHWKLAVTVPAAPTSIWYGHEKTTNIGIGATATGGTAILREGVTVSPGTEEHLYVRGLLRNGANAGNVQLQMAQVNSEAFATTIRADSYVVARRVA